MSLLDALGQFARTGRYRGSVPVTTLIRTKQILADDEGYFVATNPTPGTPIVFAVNPAVSETAGYFLSVFNKDSPGGKRIFLDYLKLLVGAVPASATAAEMLVKLDTAGFSSGGSAITPVNPNGDSAAASVATINAGALTTAVRSGNARLVTRNKLRTVIPVAGDEWDFVFAGDEFAGAGAFNGTNPQRMPVGLPPVIIAPQQFALLQLWFPANAVTPASFEFELGYSEK
jgi:hypothetical protein